MDKLKFKIFYDDEYCRPHVSIKINGKDLAKMIMDANLSYPLYLAGREVHYFLNAILISKNPDILTDGEWCEEYWSGLVKINIHETENSVIWENVRGFEKQYYKSFEFDKKQYYKEIGRLINRYGWIIPEEMLDKIPEEIFCRIGKPLRFYSNCDLWDRYEYKYLTSCSDDKRYFLNYKYFLLYYKTNFFRWYDGYLYISDSLFKINKERWVSEQWLEEKFIPQKKNDQKRMKF
jgi:hypothetical protein